jgi:DNA-binding winged helix-turn-helix (wHTH) protein
MNVERRIAPRRIGGWEFHPAAGELRRGAELRRLEPRAAKALELLSDARGAVVTHEELIAAVWSGRSVSENSVSVVIGQLRRALDDDRREPRLIETIPKRGYRLADRASARRMPPSGRQRLLIALALAGFLLVGLVATWRSADARPELAMADVVNQTGEKRYDALARATTELMLAELSRRGFDVERGGRGRMLVAGKLVMWNGEPWLGLSATDAKGVVRWSAMTRGTPDAVPAGVKARLEDFQRKVAH